MALSRLCYISNMLLDFETRLRQRRLLGVEYQGQISDFCSSCKISGDVGNMSETVFQVQPRTQSLEPLPTFVGGGGATALAGRLKSNVLKRTAAKHKT